MELKINHRIDNNPEPEDAGTIIVTATIFGEDEDNSTFTTTPLPIKDFVGDDNDDYVCQSKEHLMDFLVDAEIDEDVIIDAMTNLDVYVNGVTCSTNSSGYSPRCALKVWLDLVLDYFDDDDGEEDSLSQFDETTNNTRFRPASKIVVKSLIRKIYNKKIAKEKSNDKKISLEECTICLEEFSNGAKLVPLPCGHEFDDECIIKWFEISHFCPLCRFELPCEDQMT